MNKTFFLLLLLGFSFAYQAQDFDCLNIQNGPLLETTHATSPNGDFLLRDLFPPTEIPQEKWRSPIFGKFGPCPMTYPSVNKGKPMTIDWIQKRILAAAKKYIGLPYKHHHFPQMGGLDCSNFSSWVYNYALGIRFSSNISRQSESAGRRLSDNEEPVAGDLLYFFDEAHQRIVHVAIFIDEMNLIDASLEGIQIQKRSGRYVRNFAWARRILE